MALVLVGPDAKKVILKELYNPPVRVNAPGRYTVSLSYEATPTCTQFVATGIKYGPPIAGEPATMTGKVEGPLAMADRNLELWFPFANLETLQGSPAARVAVLKAARRRHARSVTEVTGLRAGASGSWSSTSTTPSRCRAASSGWHWPQPKRAEAGRGPG